MNILILNHEYPPIGGGAGNAAKHIAEELVQLGLQVDVVTSSFGDLPKSEQTNGVNVHRVPALRSRELESSSVEILSFAGSALAHCARRLRTSRPDLVHTLFGLPSGGIGYLLKKRTGVPYIISFRGRDVHGGKSLDSEGITGLFRTISRPVWRYADRCVANSEGLRDIAHRVTPELPIDVIPNGVDTTRFSPTASSNGRPTTFLFAGRLEPYKGLDTLLSATSQLRNRTRSPFILKIAGDGSLRHDIGRQVRELGLEKQVEIVGRVTPGDMPALYRSADVFVLPSIVEGMSNGVLEAMATGLQVVGTEIPGSEEVITNGSDGLLVRPGQDEDLMRALQLTLEDGSLREDMGQRARSSVSKRSWRSIAERYLSLYEDVIREQMSCAA